MQDSDPYNWEHTCILSFVKIQSLLKNGVQPDISTHIFLLFISIMNQFSYHAPFHFIEVLFLLHRNNFLWSGLEAIFKFPHHSVHSSHW